jgi:hypothetical protein
LRRRRSHRRVRVRQALESGYFTFRGLQSSTDATSAGGNQEKKSSNIPKLRDGAIQLSDLPLVSSSIHLLGTSARVCFNQREVPWVSVADENKRTLQPPRVALSVAWKFSRKIRWRLVALLHHFAEHSTARERWKR